MEQPRCELLAPAGNEVCLRAAVRAGANAVYLGTQDFNARRGADNFTLDSLEAACSWAHLRGVRIYLAMNTVVLPSEVDAACNLAGSAWRAGVDAFIVQDIGLAAGLSRVVPDAEIHISTQMNTHNSAGVEAASALGASRVTLARELELSEVAHLCDVAHGLGMQVEVFAHGALCICYSGQCFASSLVGGRSANRGMCAQVCRLPYELHAGAQGQTLPAPGEHLLSPKDLCTIDMLCDLVAAGVDSLKIEGRAKSPEYVYAAVSTYRAVLDRVQTGAPLGASGPAGGVAHVPCASCATEGERQRLSEAFSRGFTTAYLTGETGQSMMSYGRPNNRGVRVGRVSHVSDGMVEIDCDKALFAGDVIEFWTNKGHFAHTVDAFEKRGPHTLALAVPKPVGKGDRVFRVRSAEAAFVDDPQQPRVPVRGSIELRIGQAARMTLALAALGPAGPCAGDFLAEPAGGGALEPAGGVAVAVEGPLVEAARTKAISESDVREHINRFGNTPFVLEQLDVQLDEGVGMGFSALHHLRAEAADVLRDALLQTWDRTSAREPARIGFASCAPSPAEGFPQEGPCAARARALARSGSSLHSGEIAPQSGEAGVSKPSGGKTAAGPFAGDLFVEAGKAAATAPCVCAWATNPACARAARKAGADAVYVPALNYKRGEAFLAGRRMADPGQAGYPKRVVVALPAIDHDPVPGSRESAHDFDPWKYAGPGKTVFADSLGALHRALREGHKVEVGPHVPVTNTLAAQTLAACGVARIWLSPELTLGQIQRIAEGTQVPLGLFVSGAAELMITEHCLLQAQGPCKQQCESCPRRNAPHHVKDRKGYEMPVLTDCCGRSHLYNAVPLDACHMFPDLMGAGLSAFMVDTTLLDAQESGNAVARAIRARDLAVRTGEPLEKSKGTTTGHLFRGVS